MWSCTTSTLPRPSAKSTCTFPKSTEVAFHPTPRQVIEPHERLPVLPADRRDVAADRVVTARITMLAGQSPKNCLGVGTGAVAGDDRRRVRKPRQPGFHRGAAGS